MRGPHDKPFDGKSSGNINPEVDSGARDGEDFSLLEQLAEFSQSAGEFGSAMEYYEQIFRIAERARESSELLSEILYKMARCHSQTGAYSKALGYLDSALAQLPEDAPNLVRCRIQNERAFALMSLGEYEAAQECLRGVTEQILDPEAAGELARAQKSFGIIAMWEGDWVTANRSFEAALAGFRLIGDRSGMAQCLNNLGLMEKNRGNNQQGIEHLRAALECHEDLGDTPAAGQTLNNLGLLEFKAGAWEDAREHWERALRLQEGIGNKWEVARIRLSLGNYYRHKRDWEEAGTNYSHAREIVEELGEARELVLVKEFQGDLAFASESYEEARDLYLEALTGGEMLAPKGDLVLEAVRRLADLESRAGNGAQAKQFLAQGIALSEGMNEDFERGILLRVQARVQASGGDAAGASSSYRKSLDHHERYGSPYELAVTRLEFASFCIENIIDLEDAADHLEIARETFEQIGADYEAGHAYLLAAKLEMVCEHPSGEARDHLDSAIDLLERVGNREDQAALQEVNQDIDRLLAESSLSENNDLAALNEAVTRVRAAHDTGERVRAIERALEERMNADRVVLFLASSDTGELELASGSSHATEAGEILKIIQALKGSRDFRPRPIVSSSPSRDPRFTRMNNGALRELGSVAFMPLFSEDQMLGGIYADLQVDAGYFHQPELHFLAAFATTATMAVQEMRLESVRNENLRLRKRLASQTGFEGIVTQNRRMLEIIDLIERLRESNTTILLQGETGTGKELLARAVHAVSSRRDHELVTVNCAALSRDVLESELFGHLRGAFTDAKSDKIGLFEKAHGGTIFLDEIDKTSTEFQERLLRVVDQGEIKPVGASQVREIDVRILCATNRPLKELVDAGRFLKDLFYRLRVIAIDLPPLRERKEDVPLLVDHFLEHFTRTTGKAIPGFTHEAMNLLVAHSWPGNVRDLRHEVERAVAMANDEDRIDVEALSTEVQGAVPAKEIKLAQNQTLQELVESIERELVEKALLQTDSNRSHAAKLLGISRRGLLNKIARYSIDL